MAKKTFPRRYAQAAFEIARRKNELDKWLSDLQDMARLSADAALLAWLESPKVRFDDKFKLLKERLATIGPLALNLAGLLVVRGRFSMAGDIAAAYQQLLNNYRGIELAEVVTAVPLDEGDKQRLSERLGVVVGKKVLLKTAVDSSIIGGVVARVGGRLLDGSTRGKLQALKRQIAE